MSHPAELSGHAVWIRLLWASFAKLAFAVSLHRAANRQRRKVAMWIRWLRCQGGGWRFPRLQGVSVSPSGPSSSLQLSSMYSIRSYQALSRPTHPFSPATSPIKMYYSRHAFCLHSTICLSTSRNSFSQKQATLHHSGILPQKQWSPAKKGGKSENKNS